MKKKTTKGQRHAAALEKLGIVSMEARAERAKDPR